MTRTELKPLLENEKIVGYEYRLYNKDGWINTDCLTDCEFTSKTGWTYKDKPLTLCVNNFQRL